MTSQILPQDKTELKAKGFNDEYMDAYRDKKLVPEYFHQDHDPDYQKHCEELMEDSHEHG